MSDELPDTCPNCGAETTDTWLEAKSLTDRDGSEVTLSCTTCGQTLLKQIDD